MEKKIYRFKSLEKNDGEKMENIDWSRKNNQEFWKINSVSSYIAMFTPSLPKYFIEKYTKLGDTVMDNFSGRGTTGIVARQLGRKFIGSDLNPYAYVITKFKISRINEQKFYDALNKLEKKWWKFHADYENMSTNIESSPISAYYSKNTLAMLLFFRDEIGKKWKTNHSTKNSILAIALGLMHGQMRKDGSTSYFSLNTANTISYSPNYVRSYAKKHSLIKPDVNIFERIRKRLPKIFNQELEKQYDGKVFLWDATKSNPRIKNNSVDLIVTSPPYLNVVNYALSNWARLWLLGFEFENLNKQIILSDKFNFRKYVDFIKQYLNSVYKKLKENAKICIVVGDVHGKNLIEDVWKEIRDEFKFRFKFKEICVDEIYDERRKTTFMLNDKKGKATIVEKVLVLQKCK